MAAEEFHYRLAWRSRAHRVGAHGGTMRGSGYEFRGLAPLVSAGDPRRVDLRASARDPFRQLLVRLYTQRSAVQVHVLADVSASMAFRGTGRKLDVVADFAESLGYAAARTGDPVWFFACDAGIRTELSCRFEGGRSAGAALAERLRAFAPEGDGAAGLLAAAARLPAARALVFVLSDFYVPFDLVDGLLGRLTRHDVVPVVVRDGADRTLPATGLVRLRDAEHGTERTVVARRALRERVAARCDAHDAELARRFTAAGVRAITLVDRFDAAAMTRHFYG
jgi:uncharacterized protein (DUF58 family)